MPLPSSSPADVWDDIAAVAAGESRLWAEALRGPRERTRTAVFSPLADARFAAGIETIYEGYLAHYGRPRLFEPPDRDAALLLGDYLYAEGLVRIAALGEVEAVADLAALISRCAQLQADGAADDGAAWAATAALLGCNELSTAREALRAGGDAGALLALARGAAGTDAVERALAAHASFLR